MLFRMSDSRSSERFIRVVGRRQQPPEGQAPSAEAREAMGRMARYQTRVPKGVFIYASHEQANADRERWLIEAMVANRQNG